MAPKGVLNEHERVKKIARKRERLDDTIESIHGDDFPIKNKRKQELLHVRTSPSMMHQLPVVRGDQSAPENFETTLTANNRQMESS